MHEAAAPARGDKTRRQIIAAAVAGAGVIAATADAVTPALASPTSPAAALKEIMEGNARYVANAPTERDFTAKRAALEASQAPYVAVLACSDSRVAPEFVFDQGPGDLFVVRVAGNFVTADGLASLEYATEVLNVRLIMVLGHSNCGAIKSTLKVLDDQSILPGHVADLIRSIKPGVISALAEKGHDLALRATVANVRYNVRRLQNSPPLISAAVAAGTVMVVGGVTDLGSGRVMMVS